MKPDMRRNEGVIRSCFCGRDAELVLIARRLQLRLENLQDAMEQRLRRLEASSTRVQPRRAQIQGVSSLACAFARPTALCFARSALSFCHFSPLSLSLSLSLLLSF